MDIFGAQMDTIGAQTDTSLKSVKKCPNGQIPLNSVSFLYHIFFKIGFNSFLVGRVDDKYELLVEEAFNFRYIIVEFFLSDLLFLKVLRILECRDIRKFKFPTLH